MGTKDSDTEGLSQAGREGNAAQVDVLSRDLIGSEAKFGAGFHHPCQPDLLKASPLLGDGALLWSRQVGFRGRPSTMERNGFSNHLNFLFFKSMH